MRRWWRELRACLAAPSALQLYQRCVTGVTPPTPARVDCERLCRCVRKPLTDLLYPSAACAEPLHLDVGEGHRICVRDFGNTTGHAVLFLHGGPGSGCRIDQHRLFDPTHYRVLLVDQRGSGLSTPGGAVKANTTDRLLQDMETLRDHLGIRRWLLFGGSWGATLALRYAQTHPHVVSALVLRGTFLARSLDLAWFFGKAGAARIFPRDYDAFAGPVPKHEREDLIGAYHRRVHGPDTATATTWARRWYEWGDRVACWNLSDRVQDAGPDARRLLAKVRIETHYALNRYFLGDRPLLDGIGRLPDVPVTIVHGERDLVCPCEAAWTLHHAIPGSRLELLPDTGHLLDEPAMTNALIRATDRLRGVLSD